MLSDLLVFIAVMVPILLAATVVGYSIDCWPEWKSRNEYHKTYAWLQTAWLLNDSVGRRGTVTRPFDDPSPRPRRR